MRLFQEHSGGNFICCLNGDQAGFVSSHVTIPPKVSPIKVFLSFRITNDVSYWKCVCVCLRARGCTCVCVSPLLFTVKNTPQLFLFCSH